MNYQERVQSLAKEIAEAYGTHIVPSGCVAAAVVAMKHMADAVILYAYDGDMKAFERHEPNGGYVTNYLKEQGLTPDPQEGAENDTK